MKNFIREAFTQLDMLNEEDFNLQDTDSIQSLKDFKDSDDLTDQLSVIDVDAEDKEDLQDSYMGKVILDCCVCHSQLYKDPSEVHIDGDEDLVNVGEECPFCYSADGYKVIGEVAPYNNSEVDDVEIEEDKAEPEFAIEVEDEVTEPVAEDEEIEDLDESFENVHIETEDSIMDMNADGENISINTHPKEVVDAEIEPMNYVDAEDANDEFIGELSDDTIDEIEDQTIEDNEEDEPEEMDIDFDEFNEEDFDELGESYLKETYENVTGFKTTKVRNRDNQLFIEGLISFDSGNTRKTTFKFTPDSVRGNRLRFFGENLQISRGKKSFSLLGKLNNRKLMCESLRYNYRAVDENGDSKQVYNTLKVKRK